MKFHTDFSLSIHSGENLSCFSPTIRRKGIEATTQHQICHWYKTSISWEIELKIELGA